MKTTKGDQPALHLFTLFSPFTTVLSMYNDNYIKHETRLVPMSPPYGEPFVTLYYCILWKTVAPLKFGNGQVISSHTL